MFDKELVVKAVEIYQRNRDCRFVENNVKAEFLHDVVQIHDINKDELNDIFCQHITPDTLLSYEKIKNFGLSSMSAVEILGTSKYRFEQLRKKKRLIEIGKYRCSSHSGYGYIYRFSTVLGLVGSVYCPPPKDFCIPVEMTDRNIAEALYIVNKSAKVHRDTKEKSYKNGRHSVCKAAKTKQNKLYSLKDLAIKKLINDDSAKFIGIHCQHLEEGKDVYMRCYRVDDFLFHLPFEGDFNRNELLPDSITGLISSAKSRKDIALNYNQAVDLLKRFTGFAA